MVPTKYPFGGPDSVTRFRASCPDSASGFDSAGSRARTAGQTGTATAVRKEAGGVKSFGPPKNGHFNTRARPDNTVSRFEIILNFSGRADAAPENPAAPAGKTPRPPGTRPPWTAVTPPKTSNRSGTPPGNRPGRSTPWDAAPTRTNPSPS